jgi:LPS-assembly lipoprotein
MQRRHLLTGLSATLALASLGGCGFQLRRGPKVMAFRTIQLTGFASTSPLATELARALEASGVDVVDSTLQATQAAGTSQVPTSHLVFEALRDSRDLVVVTKTAYGQVRNMSVRTGVSFRILRGDGSVLLGPTPVDLARDLSYNERDALAKQDEAAALQRGMQTDIVNQVLRRLAAIRPEQLSSTPQATTATSAPVPAVHAASQPVR